MHDDPTSHEYESAPTDAPTPQRAEEGTSGRPRCEMRDVTVTQANESPRRFYEF